MYISVYRYSISQDVPILFVVHPCLCTCACQSAGKFMDRQENHLLTNINDSDN